MAFNNYNKYVCSHIFALLLNYSIELNIPELKISFPIDVVGLLNLKKNCCRSFGSCFWIENQMAFSNNRISSRANDCRPLLPTTERIVPTHYVICRRRLLLLLSFCGPLFVCHGTEHVYDGRNCVTRTVVTVFRGLTPLPARARDTIDNLFSGSRFTSRTFWKQIDAVWPLRKSRRHVAATRGGT